LDGRIEALPAPNGILLNATGVAFEGFLKEIQDLVCSLGLEERVMFLCSVPYSLWYDCLYAADLGVALYEPGDINNQNMAGAGNKLNLYLKAGIPSLVPAIPDFVSFVQRSGAGVVADPSDPKSIARAVNDVFSDRTHYDSYCQNARHTFETEFNFETQFAPVLHRLMGSC